MTTNNVDIKAGDNLANIAHDWYDDYSKWRDIANVAGIDIFAPLTVGQLLTKPTPEEVEDKYNKLIDEFLQPVEKVVQEIVNSREAQTIINILGVKDVELLKQLDLSTLSSSITNQLNINNANGQQVYQLIDWVL